MVGTVLTGGCGRCARAPSPTNSIVEAKSSWKSDNQPYHGVDIGGNYPCPAAYREGLPLMWKGAESPDPRRACRAAETFENPACCRRCAACIRVEPSFDLEIQHAMLALRGNCSTRSHVQPGRCRTDRRNIGTGRVYRRARRVPSRRTRFRAQGRDIPHDSQRHLLVRPVSPGSNWRRVSPGCAYRLRHHDVRPRQW